MANFKATFLADNGYLVTTPDVLMVFDYHKDPTHAVKHALNANPETPVVFLTSAHDGGNYNPDIFDLAQNHKRVYVLSNNVYTRKVPTDMPIAAMSHGDKIEDVLGGLTIEAFGHNDDGLAFLVTTKEGTTYLHAGNPDNLAEAMHRLEVDGRTVDYVLNPSDHIKVGEKVTV